MFRESGMGCFGLKHDLVNPTGDRPGTLSIHVSEAHVSTGNHMTTSSGRQIQRIVVPTFLSTAG